MNHPNRLRRYWTLLDTVALEKIIATAEAWEIMDLGAYVYRKNGAEVYQSFIKSLKENHI